MALIELLHSRSGPEVSERTLNPDLIIRAIQPVGIKIVPSVDCIEVQAARLGFNYSNRPNDPGYIDTRINSRNFPGPKILHESLDLAELRPYIGYDFARAAFMALDYTPANLYETLALLIQKKEMWLSGIPVVALGSVAKIGAKFFAPYFKTYKSRIEEGEIILPSINLMDLEELNKLYTQMVFPIAKDDSFKG